MVNQPPIAVIQGYGLVLFILFFMAYTQKFFYVSFQSKDDVKCKDLYMGDTPSEALKTAKKSNPGRKNFKVGKTPYNTLGEKM